MRSGSVARRTTEAASSTRRACGSWSLFEVQPCQLGDDARRGRVLERELRVLGDPRRGEGQGERVSASDPVQPFRIRRRDASVGEEGMGVLLAERAEREALEVAAERVPRRDRRNASGQDEVGPSGASSGAST